MEAAECELLLGTSISEFLRTCVSCLAIVTIINLVQSRVLKRFSIPKVAIEIIAGYVFSILNFDKTTIYLPPPDWHIQRTFINFIPTLMSFFSEVLLMFNVFLLGLEMDGSLIFKTQIRLEHIISISGIFTTLIFGILGLSWFSLSSLFSTTLLIATALAGTASPILIRLLTDTKIGKTNFGVFAVATARHTDCVCSVAISILYLVYLIHVGTLRTGWFVVPLQLVLAAIGGPKLLKWVDRGNPEGKQMKGSHLVFSLAFVVLLCVFSSRVGYNPVLSSFIVGFSLPREGRVSQMLISRLNCLTRSLNPIIFFWIGMISRPELLEDKGIGFVLQLGLLFLVTTVGKVLGTVVPSMLLGFRWDESLALGLLLSMKGHFHAYIAVMAMLGGYLYKSTCLVIIVVVFLTAAYAPAVVAFIIKRPGRRSPNQKMALQWLYETSELRMMLCVRSTQHVPSSINFVEISKGKDEAELIVHVTEIEVPKPVAATLAGDEGMQDVRVTSDGAGNELRDEIETKLKAYLDKNGDSLLTLKQTLALSTINNMHKEICKLAEEFVVSLIVLPYHKLQSTDHNLDEDQLGFRVVNQKMLQEAPCSVGILVDRGFGQIDEISDTYPLKAAVLFIGGKDDREALAYANRIARHPGVELTFIRLFLGTATEDSASTSGGFRRNVDQQEEEMKLEEKKFDDKYVLEFYDRQIADDHVKDHLERTFETSSETLEFLKNLEGEQYKLIIVGRGRRVNQTFTLRMNDGQECPELGDIGNILLSREFSSTASVLVIQQHSLRKEADFLDEWVYNHVILI